MKTKFKKIGLIGRQRSNESIECLQILCDFLTKQNCEIILEENTANLLQDRFFSVASQETFGHEVDLVIVVGGDGSLLNAARFIVDSGKPVIGINRGRLGFLTDIHPDE